MTPKVKLATAVRGFVRDDSGASMAEYALLLGVITVALITVITLFRDSISNLFNTTTNTLNNAGS
ncbi:MAG: Flp family type IVb pilin [Gemmatimonadota bacterium]